MSLRFVILGLLCEQPLHGYAIQAALEDRFGELCDPAFGDVYRVLEALRRDGLATVATTRVGRRPRRKVYAPSAAGRRGLAGWLRTGAGGSARGGREERWLRALVAERCAADLLPVVLEDEVHRRRQAVRELEALRPEVRGDPGFLALVLGLRHASALDEARIALRGAERCRRVLDRHRRGASVAELLRALERLDDADGAREPPDVRRVSGRGVPTG